MPDTIWDDSNLRTATATQMATMAWAIANTLSEVNNRLAKDNANRVDEYTRQFAAYVQQKNDRPDATNIQEPTPAFAEIVVFNQYGWPEVAPGPNWVCKKSIYQPVPANPQSWFHTPDTSGSPDKFVGPVGTAVTKTDGTKWMRFA